MDYYVQIILKWCEQYELKLYLMTNIMYKAIKMKYYKSDRQGTSQRKNH